MCCFLLISASNANNSYGQYILCNYVLIPTINCMLINEEGTRGPQWVAIVLVHSLIVLLLCPESCYYLPYYLRFSWSTSSASTALSIAILLDTLDMSWIFSDIPSIIPSNYWYTLWSVSSLWLLHFSTVDFIHIVLHIKKDFIRKHLYISLPVL